MADPITLMAAISAGTALASGGIAAAGTIAQGNAQLEIAKAERKQLARMAAEELAVATRGAETKNKEVQGLKSRVQAVSASSGGMATDNSVLEVVGNIAKEGNVQTRDILRQGQVRGDDLMYRGRVGVNSAKLNRDLSRLTATGQVISAAGDAFSKYGQGLPSTSSAPRSSWWG
jgi:hypothetical protein